MAYKAFKCYCRSAVICQFNIYVLTVGGKIEILEILSVNEICLGFMRQNIKVRLTHGVRVHVIAYTTKLIKILVSGLESLSLLIPFNPYSANVFDIFTTDVFSSPDTFT